MKNVPTSKVSPSGEIVIWQRAPAPPTNATATRTGPPSSVISSLTVRDSQSNRHVANGSSVVDADKLRAIWLPCGNTRRQPDALPTGNAKTNSVSSGCGRTGSVRRNVAMLLGFQLSFTGDVRSRRTARIRRRRAQDVAATTDSLQAPCLHPFCSALVVDMCSSY